MVSLGIFVKINDSVHIVAYRTYGMEEDSIN